MRYSIEVEYWVIDEQGRLTEPGALVDASDGAEREFVEPLLEIKTTPCANATALREEFFERVGETVEEAQRLGKGLVPLGTPVFEGPIDDLPKERTQIQDRAIGENFDYVRHCAGTHIHVEQLPGREIDQLNALIALDPALALVNSSPYFEGRELAAGARSKLYRWMAYEQLPRQGTLWPYAESRTDWAKRLDARYREFVTEAVVAGFDRPSIESCFDVESAVWTPVQLREEFSTVEWRSPDAALPGEIVQLATEIIDLMEHLADAEVRIEGQRGYRTDDALVLPEFEFVEQYVEAAIEEGLSSDGLRDYLDRLGIDVASFDPLSAELAGQGELTESEARELRLDCADRLAEAGEPALRAD